MSLICLNFGAVQGKVRGQVAAHGRRFNTHYFDADQAGIEECARAVDLLIYKARGPDAPTNFPVPAEQRQRLDGMSLEELEAEFREEGAKGGVFSSGSSQFRGVSWVKNISKWRAEVSMGGQSVKLGFFVNEQAAAAAYDAAAFKHKGSAARLNFPAKYLTPGQDPPALETEIPDEAARGRLEAAAQGKAPSTTQANKPRKRQDQGNQGPRRKKAADPLPEVQDPVPGATVSDGGPEEDEGDLGSTSDEESSGFGSDLVDYYDFPSVAWVDTSDEEEPRPDNHGMIVNPMVLDAVERQLGAAEFDDYDSLTAQDLACQIRQHTAAPPQPVDAIAPSAAPVAPLLLGSPASASLQAPHPHPLPSASSAHPSASHAPCSSSSISSTPGVGAEVPPATNMASSTLPHPPPATSSAHPTASRIPHSGSSIATHPGVIAQVPPATTVAVSRIALNAARKAATLQAFAEQGLNDDWAYDCYQSRELLGEPSLGIVDGVDLVKLYNLEEALLTDDEEPDTLVEVDASDPHADIALQKTPGHMRQQQQQQEQHHNQQQQQAEREAQAFLAAHLNPLEAHPELQQPTGQHLPSLQTKPLADLFCPQSDDFDFHMSVADQQLRRAHAEAGLLYAESKMPGEDKPTHMLARRRELAAESAARARAFRSLEPFCDEHGQLVRPVVTTRHPQDEQVCETLIGQMDLLLRGRPLTINVEEYAWIRDTEPGFGPLRPKGAPAPDDHPAYVLLYLHEMRVPLEEDSLPEGERQKCHLQRLAHAKEICVKGKARVEEERAGAAPAAAAAAAAAAAGGATGGGAAGVGVRSSSGPRLVPYVKPGSTALPPQCTTASTGAGSSSGTAAAPATIFAAAAAAAAAAGSNSKGGQSVPRKTPCSISSMWAAPKPTHVPSRGPASSRMSPELFNQFVDGHMETPENVLEFMEVAWQMYHAIKADLDTEWGGKVPQMVWEPCAGDFTSFQDCLVLQSKAIHAAGQRCGLKMAQEYSAPDLEPRLDEASPLFDPLLRFCFLRCFFDGWVEQAVAEFRRAATPLYLQRREHSRQLESLIARREESERKWAEKKEAETAAAEAAAAQAMWDQLDRGLPPDSPPYKLVCHGPESAEAQADLAFILAHEEQAAAERKEKLANGAKPLPASYNSWELEGKGYAI